jgi:alpha-ketoglutarate-dependent taurine dioxygenase
MEFDTLRSEERFFERHGLRVSDVQQEVALSAGQLLVFDNLAVAHGRRGVRRPGELRQWVFGEEALGVDAQRWVRDRILIAFNR